MSPWIFSKHMHVKKPPEAWIKKPERARGNNIWVHTEPEIVLVHTSEKTSQFPQHWIEYTENTGLGSGRKH